MEEAEPTRRRRLSADERRHQLVEVAGDLLVSVPLDEVTMQRVSEVAGVSRTLVFHYFPTVRALHLAALERAAANLLESLVQAAMAAPYEERISHGLDAFIDYITAQPKTFLAMAGYAGTEPEFGEIFDNVRDWIVDLVVEFDGIEVDELGRAMLRGWVVMAEASVIRWLQGADIERSDLTEELVSVKDGITSRLLQRSTTTVG